MKYVCVPVEPTEVMLDAVKIGHPLDEGATGMLLRRLNRERWTTMLAAAPPLPDSIEAAVELARQQLKHFTAQKYEKENAIARALLKCVGKEAE